MSTSPPGRVVTGDSFTATVDGAAAHARRHAADDEPVWPCDVDPYPEPPTRPRPPAPWYHVVPDPWAGGI